MQIPIFQLSSICHPFETHSIQRVYVSISATSVASQVLVSQRAVTHGVTPWVSALTRPGKILVSKVNCTDLLVLSCPQPSSFRGLVTSLSLRNIITNADLLSLFTSHWQYK